MSGLLINKVAFGKYDTVTFVCISFGEVKIEPGGNDGSSMTWCSNQSDGCPMLNFPLGPVKVENCVCADAFAIAHIDANNTEVIEIVNGICFFIY